MGDCEAHILWNCSAIKSVDTVNLGVTSVSTDDKRAVDKTLEELVEVNAVTVRVLDMGSSKHIVPAIEREPRDG